MNTSLLVRVWSRHRLPIVVGALGLIAAHIYGLVREEQSPGPAAIPPAAAKPHQFAVRVFPAAGHSAAASAISGAPIQEFAEWIRRYGSASGTERRQLEERGRVLAAARRRALHALIQSDPERALMAAIPTARRLDLPPSIVALLESPVSGKGDLLLFCGSPERRVAFIDGVEYRAYVYGRRSRHLSKEGTSLHGIALDGIMAVHESPVRRLESGESPRLRPIPVGGVAPASSGEWIEAQGKVFEVAAGFDFGALERSVMEAEERALPRVQDVADVLRSLGEPPRAPDTQPSHTIGNKKVLVLRVDFSDFSGESVSATDAQSLMDNGVRPWIEEVSYGRTSVTTTVSTKVYRLPRRGAEYALNNESVALHSDARAAAAADFPIETYDRILVAMPSLGTNVVPGSHFPWGGLATIGGTTLWVQGTNAFVLLIIAHELGHSYGLPHAGIWRVTDGNPISAQGTAAPTEDPFDTMGSTGNRAISDLPRDSQFHFNPWFKNYIDWLPETAVTTVKTSGVYRIHRFDHRSADLTKPLALRIFRDGVRNYWVGYRQKFTGNSALSNGAYVLWGFNRRVESQLLDCATPGSNNQDAALPVSASISDPDYGIAIKTLARGGDEPNQWLDIEVTMPTAAPNVPVAWGRDAELMPDGETNLMALAAGDRHFVALKFNGRVISWGNNDAGQTTVPPDLTDVIAVAASRNVSAAVKRDGTAVFWGDSSSPVRTERPASLANIKQLALGYDHALALRTDGTVIAWGSNTYRQTTIPADLGVITAIAAGDRNSLALRANGTAVVWGVSFSNAVPTPSAAVLSDITAIATNGQHALALKADGTVIGWGSNNSHQAIPPASLTGVVAIAAGGFHSLAVRSDGTIVGWGSNVWQQTAPTVIPKPFALAAGMSSSAAIVGATVSITTPPRGETIAAGGAATLQVTAAGAGALAYQWRKDGVAIAGATSSQLVIPNAGASSAGRYDVVVTSGGVSITSAPAEITIASEVSRIANLSIRTTAGAGDETLIVGFAVGGGGASGTKPLLLRGIGPALTAFGVDGALSDPKMELFNATSVRIAENDNWAGATLVTAASQVGAFPLLSGSRDAALSSTGLERGAYSVQISGAGGQTGIALAEIYDLSPSGPTFGDATPRLVNVSARAISGADADVLIAGFAIAGPAAKTVLVRAIGPTLAQFGVSGAHDDPRLELFDASARSVQTNDNWGGTAALSAAFRGVGAFPLAAASLDAALLATLAPGTYTVQVTGAGNRRGVVLAELYEVP